MSAEEVNLELLKKQRAKFKGQLTYFKNQCSTASTLGSYESLLRRIQLVYEKYDFVQSKIESADDASVNDRDSFEDEYGKLEAMILNRIRDLKRAEDNTLSSSFKNDSIHKASACNGSSAGIRLPELKLPSFSGADSEWLAFRDVFVDLIHNKNIDSTVKFVYLISHLRSGSAYNLIESLPVTADNYEIAWKTICDRYNNEISIQKLHMKELYEIRIPQENSANLLQCFLDHAVKHYNALKSLKVKIDEWDLMLTHHLTQRLDSASRAEVIRSTKTNKIISFTDLIQVLRSRVQLIQALQSNNTHQYPRQSRDTRKSNSKSNRMSVLMTNPNKCSYCSGAHLILHCSSFTDKKLSPQMRFRFIRDNHLCTNCLLERHNVRECMKPPCAICSLKHNGLLHFKNFQIKQEPKVTTSPKVNASSINITTSKPSIIRTEHENNEIPNGTGTISASHITASTLEPARATDKSAVVKDKTGLVMIGTALVNAISSNGIGGQESNIKHTIYLTISSRVSTYTVDLKLYVLSKITNDLPSARIKFETPSIPITIQLADPYFNVPDRIDVLLGVEVYNQLFKGDFLKPFKELPPFYNTELGYVICGKAESSSSHQSNNSYVALCNMENLESQLKKFWELESISLKNTYSSEEKDCEEHYCKNVRRLSCGRYSVALPTKVNVAELGPSDHLAHRQFISLEKRLRLRETVYAQYRNFMSEYISLGHMVPAAHTSDAQTYYLPHHYVIKESSTTTKLRVVFYASAKTSSSLSLNDCLMVGPTIQQTLFAIILRFRKYIYAFSGDIAKMYRQIHVRDDDQNLQRIWWRNQDSDELQSFKLCTVTYGTASAPYLATRTLKQLSIDEHDSYPSAAKVVVNDFYVDDVLTGSSTLHEAVRLKSDLINLLQLGGFELRKL